MAIEISGNFKEEMLNDVMGGTVRINHKSFVAGDPAPLAITFNTVRTAHGAYLEAENITLPVEVTGDSYEVNKLVIMKNDTPYASNELYEIELEGNEIHNYTTNGTYTINRLRISL